MKLPAGTAIARCVPLAALGLAAGLAVIPARGSAQQPAPTTPTIPTPVVRPHTAAKQAAAPPAQPNAVPADEKADAALPPELSLGECISIALERQPTIQAVRKRQEATEASLRGLNGIGRVGQALAPDLPVRKEQATRGITAAAADLQKVHNEVVQDVTRLYFTVLFAREQEKIADDVVGRLEVLTDLAEKLLNSKMPGTMSKMKLDVMKIGLADSRTMRRQAQIGQRQAVAALREAMAVCDSEFQFRVKEQGLPVMAQKVPLTKDQVVSMALDRRPELALAAAGVDAFRLEVYAQGKLHFRRAVPTLASGADIHAQEVPQAVRTLKDYRPGAIQPEMPPQLVGTKYDRVSRAMAYSQRAEAVYDKARNLVVLEAETAFYDLELASERLTFAQEKNEHGKSLTTYVNDNFADAAKEKDVMLQLYVAGAKAQSDYIEALYQHLLVLAALERVTAGGVCPAFPGR